MSLPRLRPHAGSFRAPYKVSDRDIVHIITALRIFLPRLGISISTREEASFRENLVSIGVTKMSAGSSTYVGGRTIEPHSPGDLPQFEIADKRDVSEIIAMLERKGYHPVLKDWLQL